MIVVAGHSVPPVPRVPAEVSHVVAADAVPFAQDTLRQFGRPYSTLHDISMGRVVPIAHWSKDALLGRPASAPISTSEAWLAVVRSGDRPVGTITLERERGAAVITGMDVRAELATAVQTMPEDDLLVIRPDGRAVSVSQDEQVRALDEPSQGLVRAGTDLDSVLADMKQEADESARAAATIGPDAVGGLPGGATSPAGRSAKAEAASATRRSEGGGVERTALGVGVAAIVAAAMILFSRRRAQR